MRVISLSHTDLTIGNMKPLMSSTRRDMSMQQLEIASAARLGNLQEAETKYSAAVLCSKHDKYSGHFGMSQSVFIYLCLNNKEAI